MTRALGIEVEGVAVERVRVDLAAVLLFEGERPLRGGAGRADWRLCGKLSALVAAGRLSGALGEAALVASFGGLGAPLLLVLGAGRRQELDVARLEALAGEAARRAVALRAGALAVALAEGGEPVDDEQAAALVRGLAGGVAAGPEGAGLRVVVAAPREELGRSADLLRRVRGTGLSPRLQLSLPGGEREAAPSGDREPVSRGTQLVK